MTNLALAGPPPRSEAAPIPWPRLTQQPRKANLYAQEAPVREAWLDLYERFGAEAAGLLGRLATVVLKPEAIAGRRLAGVLDYLRRQHFTPIACRPVPLTRPLAHALWRYQWNKATVDRTRLHVFVAERCPSLLLVLEDRRPEPGIPAPVRLWGLKGATHESLRQPHHLRSMLGMRNRMIGFVHTADEPADILREQGLFFDTAARGAFWRGIAAGLGRERTERVLAAGRRLERRAPAHSIDIDEVAGRLRRSAPPELRALLDHLPSGTCHPLEKVLGAFGPMPDEMTRWDFIVLAAELIQHDLPGVEPMLDAQALPLVRQRWQEAGS